MTSGYAFLLGVYWQIFLSLVRLFSPVSRTNILLSSYLSVLLGYQRKILSPVDKSTGKLTDVLLLTGGISVGISLFSILRSLPAAYSYSLD